MGRAATTNNVGGLKTCPSDLASFLIWPLEGEYTTAISVSTTVPLEFNDLLGQVMINE